MDQNTICIVVRVKAKSHFLGRGSREINVVAAAHLNLGWEPGLSLLTRVTILGLMVHVRVQNIAPFASLGNNNGLH